ncbi:gmd [Acrasis kona]|uniref:GDP-mannose 4,6-dehydratase n=1 Tax=Acrasis kona TaxID=1008807 RepID=A0AAW2Z542_9EUKA
MYLMLQQEKPEDYVVATGETHSVREFCEKAFKYAGIEIEWKGEQGTVDETAVNKANGQVVIRIDKRYFRPTEVDLLLGDPAKAQKQLNWNRKVSFDELVKGMVEGDIELLREKDSEVVSRQYHE